LVVAVVKSTLARDELARAAVGVQAKPTRGATLLVSVAIVFKY